MQEIFVDYLTCKTKHLSIPNTKVDPVDDRFSQASLCFQLRYDSMTDSELKLTSYLKVLILAGENK